MTAPGGFHNWQNTNYIEFAEGTPEAGFTLDSGRISRRIKVEWDPLMNKVQQAVIDFVGFAELKLQGGKTYISRTNPHPFRNMPNRAAGDFWLWCTGVPSIKGIAPQGADNNDTQSYKLAELTLSYQSLTYKICEDAQTVGLAGPWTGIPDESRLLRYVTRLVKPAGKILTLPFGFMRTAVNAVSVADGKLIREGIPFHVPSAQVTFIHHVRPDVPDVAIQAAMGALNSAALGPYPAQTLRLDDVDVKPLNSQLGDRVYDLQFRMYFQPNVSPITGDVRGQNWILRRITTGANRGRLDYCPITSDGAAPRTSAPWNTPYRLSDFADLFRPDQ